MVTAHEDPVPGRPPAASWWSTIIARPASRWPTCSARRATGGLLLQRLGGIASLRQESYDCIITDLKMPGMSGLEFIVQLEAAPLRRPRWSWSPPTPPSHSAVEAMRHGAFDYIEKPFDVDQLERLVAQAIRHGRLLKQPAWQSRRRPGRAAGDDRLEPADAGPAGADCPGGPHAGNHPHHRRKRHRQGTGGQGGPCGQRSPRRPAGEPQLPRALCAPDGKRVVRPRARGLYRRRRPAHRAIRNGRRRLDTARRSDRDRPAPASEAARACCKSGRSSASAPARRNRSMSACWPLPTATCRPKWRPAASARTCTSAWPWCRCTCRRCASAARTSPN